MQIQVNPADLSQAQREALASFLLTYPAAAASPAFPSVAAEIVEGFRSVGVSAEVTSATELETLQHDHESTIPAAAFGHPTVDAAVAAFGLPTPGPTAIDLGRPLTAAESPAATFGAANVPALQPHEQGSGMPNAPMLGGVAKTPIAGVELDVAGLPWDGRIHASTKTKTKPGNWTARRGVDPALVTAVEAELRALMGAPAAPLPPVVLTAPIVPTPPLATVGPVTASLPTVSASPAVAPQPPQAAPAPVAGGDADPRQAFVALVGRASAAAQQGKISQAEIAQICTAHGVPALPLLANRLDLVPAVAAQVDALIASRG